MIQMDIKDILSRCDHTLLRQDSTWAEIKELCDQGMKYSVASVCIPASFVAQAAEYVDGKLPVCTVVGFPNGYSTSAARMHGHFVASILVVFNICMHFIGLLW